MAVTVYLVLLWLTGTLFMRCLRDLPLTSGVFVRNLPDALAAGIILQHLWFLIVSWWWPGCHWYPLIAPIIMLCLVLRYRGPSAKGSLNAQGVEEAISLQWLPLLVLLVLQLAIIWPSLGLPLFDWDVRMLWALKAKFLVAEGTLQSDAFLDPYRLHIHPRYPVMIPWLAALFSQEPGGFQEQNFRIAVLLFAFMATWKMYGCIMRRAGWMYAGACTLILVLTGSWLAAQVSVQVELALACLLLLALDRLSRWAEHGDIADLVLCGLFLAGAVMTKNEGILLALCAILAPAVFAERGMFLRGLRVSAGLGAGLGAALLPWLLQLRTLPAVSDENYLRGVDTARIVSGLRRLPEIFQAMGDHLWYWPLWHVFWVGFVALAIGSLLCRRNIPPPVKYGIFVATAYLAGIVLVYILSPWRDIALQVNVSFGRVALPVLPASLLVMGLLAGRRAR